MMEMEFELITENPMFSGVTSAVRKKKLAVLYKKGMKHAVFTWHKMNIHKHFSRYAFALYPLYNTKDFLVKTNRSSNKNPLVRSGTLKKNISEGIKVTAQQKGFSVKGQMRIGRPDMLNAEGDANRSILKNQITKRVLMTGETRKQAGVHVGKENSYGRDRIKNFQDLIGTFNKEEKQKIADLTLKYVIDHWKKPRTKKKTKKRFR